MSEVKPYSVDEAAHLAAHHGAPATRCPLEDDRFFETARALATTQARIEELEHQLESVTAQRDVARALADATGHSDLVAQRNRAVTELASVKAELHRWQHGHQVEGDYVCPLMPDLDEANIVIERGAVALRAAQKRIEELEAALREVEFGSCDGCGLMRHCAYCGASKDNWGPSNESLPPEHTADCPVGVALGKAKS